MRSYTNRDEVEAIIWSEYVNEVEPYVRTRGGKASSAMWYIIDQYSEPHRVYHYLDHLANVLTELRRWRWRLNDREYLTAFVALLLHDVIYEIPAVDRSNEDLSADWVSWFVQECGIRHAVDQDAAVRAIRITEGHQPTDLVSLAVCWCDLATFADPQKSKEASEKIAQEYLQVYTPEQYAEGRRKFLTSYRSPFKVYPDAPLSLRLRARRLNRKANRQLDRELAELDGGAT